jgi:hypothetical protein
MEPMLWGWILSSRSSTSISTPAAASLFLPVTVFPFGVLGGTAKESGMGGEGTEVPYPLRSSKSRTKPTSPLQMARPPRSTHLKTGSHGTTGYRKVDNTSKPPSRHANVRATKLLRPPHLLGQHPVRNPLQHQGQQPRNPVRSL